MRDGPTCHPHKGDRPSFSDQILKSSGSVGTNPVSPLPAALFLAGLPSRTSTGKTACNCPTGSCCVQRCFDFRLPDFHPGVGVGEGPGDGRRTCCHEYSFFSIFAGNSGAAWRTGPAHTRGQSSLKPRSPEPSRLVGAPAAILKQFSNSSRKQPAISQDGTPGRNTMLAPPERSGAVSPPPSSVPAIPPPSRGAAFNLQSAPESCSGVDFISPGIPQRTRHLAVWGLVFQLRISIERALAGADGFVSESQHLSNSTFQD